MRCLAVIAALLTVALAAPLRGETVECIPDNGCPKDQKPPDCCQPPPCDVYRQLGYLKTMARAFSPDVFAVALEITGGDARKALVKVLETRAPLLPTFCQGSSHAFMEHELEVLDDKPGCPIVSTRTGKPVSREGAHLLEDRESGRPYCQEFVDVEYDSMENLQQWCLDPTEADREDMVHQYHVNYSMAADEIMSQLQHAWSVCTTKFGATAQGDLALQGIDVLIKKQAPKKKLQSKGKSKGESAKGARSGR